jgi:hypothetical protein
MKKTIASLAAFFLVLSVPSVIAQMPLAVPTMPVASLALERIGVVAAAQGKVELTTPGQIGRIAQSGQVIYMGDEVTTDEKGQLQILLLDETVFKIGPNSSIIIDKFVYDPKTIAGEIKASITKGVFRYVSGKIAAKNPDSVKVKLPTATIGFRGTIVGGSVEPNGQGLVGLLGPGDNNDSGARIGSFTIDGEGGGQQEVNRSGFGVEVGADGGISDVFQLSDDQMNGLTGGLGGDQSGGSGEGGDAGLGGDSNMGDLSGENNALTGANTLLLGGLENFSDNLNDISDKMAQEISDQSGATPETGCDQTTYEQLRAASGSGSYAVAGIFGTNGALSGLCEIFFGPSGEIGGGSSYITISEGSLTDRTSTEGLPETRPFSGSGPASFSWDDVEGNGGGTFDITVTLSNSGGTTAENLKVEVVYTTGNTGTPASGNGTGTGPLDPAGV